MAGWALIMPGLSRLDAEDSPSRLLRAETPRGAALYDALLAIAPIEWNRIGDAQDVTMRVIGEQLLPDAVRGTTYVRGEVSQQRSRLLRLNIPCRGAHRRATSRLAAWEAVADRHTCSVAFSSRIY